MPVRKNILNLSQTSSPPGAPSELTIFNTALARMQTLPAFMTSYNRIARFHGCPLGCCVHSNEPDLVRRPLFLAWHRHYIYLFEREFLTAQAQLGIPIANRIGLPYWDCTSSSVPIYPFPAVFGSTPLSSASVTIPNGCLPSGRTTTTVIRNPHSSVTNSSPTITAGSLHLQVVTAMLTSTFANFQSSLEIPHGLIHQRVVGGDMATSVRASYDPLFWLHHCNIDRVWSSWHSIRVSQDSLENIYGSSQSSVLNSNINAGQPTNSPCYQFFNSCFTGVLGYEQVHQYKYDTPFVVPQQSVILRPITANIIAQDYIARMSPLQREQIGSSTGLLYLETEITIKQRTSFSYDIYLLDSEGGRTIESVPRVTDTYLGTLGVFQSEHPGATEGTRTTQTLDVTKYKDRIVTQRDPILIAFRPTNSDNTFTKLIVNVDKIRFLAGITAAVP
jgi:hypothetical protein